MSPSLSRRVRHVPLLLGAALALGACGDGEVDDSVPVGGGAGDATENAAVLRAYVSTWNLGPLQGATAGDMAFLVVDAPNEGGESSARLQEFSALDGCYDTPVGGTGTVSVDPNGFGVFMNDILEFEQALLTLSDDGATLGIEHGPRGARRTTEASRNDGLVDFQPRC